MKKKGQFDFNFWPSYTDIMLSLVLILFLVISITHLIYSGYFNVAYVRNNQILFIRSIAELFEKDIDLDFETIEARLSIDNNSNNDIVFINEPTFQRIRFNANVLFQKNEYELSERGRRILKIVGSTIKRHIGNISEIQIQGHADPDPTLTYHRFGNLELAGLRAMAVYSFLRDEVGIDPIKNLMSATSFGEYKPIKRSESDSNFTIQKLREANLTEKDKQLNRRIEILLFYRY